MKNFIKILFLCVLVNFTQASDSLIVTKKHQIPSFFNVEKLDCDACGCSVGGASSGFESILNPQFVGVKYLHQTYRSKTHPYVQHHDLDENYNTIQVWARFPILKNVDVYGSLPYHFHQRDTNPKQNINGVGDFSGMLIYKVKLDSTNVNRLNVGIGLKAPIAKFDEELADAYNPSFQLGTGSWDYSAILNYTYVKNYWAFSFSTDYTFKNENKKHYRFGDQWNTNVMGYYIRYFENFTLSPGVGLSTEKYFQNVQLGEEIPHTGGYLILGKIGTEISLKKINIGVEFQVPLKSKLSENLVKMSSRNSLYINFNL